MVNIPFVTENYLYENLVTVGNDDYGPLFSL